MFNYGRLTVKGSEQFEKSLTSVLDDISKDIKSLISKDLYEAIILIGGYGRGEGGVVVENGVELPHNNFDFVVISKNINDSDKDILNTLCKNIFDYHTKKLGIFVEFSIISAAKLMKTDPLVITYDMKYGHKVIAGNSDFLIKSSNFEVDTIPSWDIRNLIVNRGTLLIINDLILQKENLTLKDEKIVVKHWIKAIIGYGDALLYYLGEYNYSYVEKQNRMKNIQGVDGRFKALYNKAMEFRFSPDYKSFNRFNIKRYQDFIKKELKVIHFRCEELALNNVSISSKVYIDKAVEQSLEDNNTLKGTIKKAIYLIKSSPKIRNLSFVDSLKYKMIGMKGMMPILFPFIAYGIKGREFDGIVGDFFQSKIQENSLKNQYLRYWKTYVNSNFVREDFGI